MASPECPALCPEALEDAREVFENRENARYRRLAHIVSRLAQALVRDGRFAIHDKVLDVSIALEGMYDLPRRGVTNALEERVAGFLGIDAESRDRIGKNARAFLRRAVGDRSQPVGRGDAIHEWRGLRHGLRACPKVTVQDAVRGRAG